MVSFAAEISSGDIAKMVQAKNLGTLLDEVYPDGSRAPDDLAHWVVEMHRSVVPVTVETTNYLPEPMAIVAVSRSNNPRSPDKEHVDDLGMSM